MLLFHLGAMFYRSASTFSGVGPIIFGGRIFLSSLLFAETRHEDGLSLRPPTHCITSKALAYLDGDLFQLPASTWTLTFGMLAVGGRRVQDKGIKIDRYAIIGFSGDFSADVPEALKPVVGGGHLKSWECVKPHRNLS